MENYRVSSSFGMDLTRHEYLKNVNQAQNDIHIICGEFDPVFYNSAGFVTIIEKFLSNKKGKIQIILHKQDNYDKAVSEIRIDNRNFFDMLSKLSTDIKNNVEFYWIPFRPERHYLVVDNYTTVVEGDHDEMGVRDLYCFLENKKVANKWNNIFDQVKGKCSKIELSELVK